MVRSLSRGRFDHSPAIIDVSDPYHDTRLVDPGPSAMRPIKKQSYTPRGAATTTSRTPPRSPLDAAARSASRGRFNRERGGGREYADYEDRRDPLNEGRTFGHSSSFGRSASSARDRFADDDEDNQSLRSIGGSSTKHARDVLSKIRSGRSGTSDRGMYTEPRERPPLRSLGRERGGGTSVHIKSSPSPSHRRRIDPSLRDSPLQRTSPPHQSAADHNNIPYSSKKYNSENYNDANAIPASRYELMGMKEELKKKDEVAAELRREIDETALKYEEELKKKDEATTALHHEMEKKSIKYEENVNAIRTKLVSTFKEDMREMKSEWEEAFERLKDEGDSTQRALEMEVNEVTHAKAELESQLNEMKAEHRTRMEEERRVSEEERRLAEERFEEERRTSEEKAEEMKEKVEELRQSNEADLERLKQSNKEDLEELRRSKEEDLERLRSMYEEHLDSTKRSASNIEAELKEEIHVLLEENEKVKLCYERLEGEMQAVKSDLEGELSEIKSENDRWGKEYNSVKDELDDVLDENDKNARHNKTLESELGNVKKELESSIAGHQRLAADKLQLEKELDATSQDLEATSIERDKVRAECKTLVKKLEDVEEERELEGRYTEALVKQRDNMNSIIENSQRENDELKGINNELENANRNYISLGKEFRLENGEATTLRKELARAEQYASVAEDFHLGDAGAVREELVRLGQFVRVAAKFGLDDAPAVSEKLSRAEQFASTAEDFHLRDAADVREELTKAEKMKDRLEALGRERERYNATVKALKVDLKALHCENIGSETSLQEHMRLLNEKWDANESRLKQIDKLKEELEESIGLLEEHTRERERLLKEHHTKVTDLQHDLQESQTALVRVERERVDLEEKLSDCNALDAKKERIVEELEVKCRRIQDRLAFAEDELRERESRCNSLDSDKTKLQAEVDKLQSKRTDLEDALEKMDDVKKGLKKKLESAYYDLEESQRHLESTRQEHEGEIRALEAELSKLPEQRDTITSQEEAIQTLRETLERTRHECEVAVEEAKADARTEVAASYKEELRHMKEKHADQEQRNGKYIKQKHKGEIDELLATCNQLERTVKDQKEILDQKSLTEVKRRGEFAKQKQELEILRSKERHLETHVGQLEEHISKVVANYEAKLQNSNVTVCSEADEENKVLKKQLRELEKKLEVSTAAMKQIGKSSLLMEKENDRLKHDKNELKLKLKKLVDCAEKFGPR